MKRKRTARGPTATDNGDRMIAGATARLPRSLNARDRVGLWPRASYLSGPIAPRVVVRAAARRLKYVVVNSNGARGPEDRTITFGRRVRQRLRRGCRCTTCARLAGTEKKKKK